MSELFGFELDDVEVHVPFLDSSLDRELFGCQMAASALDVDECDAIDLLLERQAVEAHVVYRLPDTPEIGFLM